jgi:hypothetical protein
MPLLYMSNMPRPQQMALSGTCFYRASVFPRQNHFKEYVAPSITRLDISRFLHLGVPEGVYRNKPRTIEALKDDIRLEIANLRTVFCGERRWPFAALDVTSSSSP